ncbi:uncharacterized protein SPPG_02011 [Spizellomyces punctatus DAOM BR117]|uniref:Uncharacterized protein n=1 Tax=Spizellomyces punctatus (strain DAOM BR117) TaxID=645134 RepID=A0A0L0HNC9_SPIPD|nr:uncharacterized protein SPPG_02011 [Spizellomyces punctatus DAOM BR117]KND02931.1 hypothetical protein SPPG_02011 [Spizellomyces punctatus DAOM BR117]|eukprot:XP_016610970.1 hypothetical protein SPPG_02011 [Spizellomyces punctatus DAOM BR117]
MTFGRPPKSAPDRPVLGLSVEPPQSSCTPLSYPYHPYATQGPPIPWTPELLHYLAASQKLMDDWAASAGLGSHAQGYLNLFPQLLLMPRGPFAGVATSSSTSPEPVACKQDLVESQRMETPKPRKPRPRPVVNPHAIKNARDSLELASPSRKSPSSAHASLSDDVQSVQSGSASASGSEGVTNEGIRRLVDQFPTPPLELANDPYAFQPEKLNDTLERKTRRTSRPVSSSSTRSSRSYPSTASLTHSSLSTTNGFGAMFHPLDLPPILSPPIQTPVTPPASPRPDRPTTPTIDEWLNFQSVVSTDGFREQGRRVSDLEEWKREWSQEIRVSSLPSLTRQLSNSGNEALLNAILLNYTLGVNRLREPCFELQRATLRKSKSEEIVRWDDKLNTTYSPRPAKTSSFAGTRRSLTIQEDPHPKDKTTALIEYSTTIDRLERPSLDSQRAVLRPVQSSRRTYGKIRSGDSTTQRVVQDGERVLEMSSACKSSCNALNTHSNESTHDTLLLEPITPTQPYSIHPTNSNGTPKSRVFIPPPRLDSMMKKRRWRGLKRLVGM